ncbi:alpha/beta fold hydrolase [Paraburkholderia sp. GAS199]
MALDIVGLLDGLGISKVAVIGHDWGTRVATRMA